MRFVQCPVVVAWQGMSPVSSNLWISMIKTRPFQAYSVVFGLPIWRCDNFCLSPMLIIYALYLVSLWSLWRNLFEASYQRFICTLLNLAGFSAQMSRSVRSFPYPKRISPLRVWVKFGFNRWPLAQWHSSQNIILEVIGDVPWLRRLGFKWHGFLARCLFSSCHRGWDHSRGSFVGHSKILDVLS